MRFDFYLEDGGNKFLRNVGYYLQYYTTYKPRRSTSEYSLPSWQEPTTGP